MFKFYFEKSNKHNWEFIVQNCLRTIREQIVTEDTCVEIKRLRKQPSDKQRGYYWAVVLPAIKKGLIELGNDDYTQKDDVHIFMKMILKYYDKKIVRTNKSINKSIVFKSVGNDKGDKKETTEYIDACIRWSAENLGIVIPEAEKYGY